MEFLIENLVVFSNLLCSCLLKLGFNYGQDFDPQVYILVSPGSVVTLEVCPAGDDIAHLHGIAAGCVSEHLCLVPEESCLGDADAVVVPYLLGIGLQGLVQAAGADTLLCDDVSVNPPVLAVIGLHGDSGLEEIR